MSNFLNNFFYYSVYLQHLRKEILLFDDTFSYFKGQKDRNVIDNDFW